MDYFTILNLNREPFSNSPDPDYFYHSRQHLDCSRSWSCRCICAGA